MALSYSQEGRLSQVTAAGVALALYTYDPYGRRATKTLPGSPSTVRVYSYDRAGHLLAEANGQGGVVTEYIWLEDSPVAEISGGMLYAMHDDALGTPQRITDSTQTVVWDAVVTPWGEMSSLTASLTNNLRLPGQYYDAETGYHQNGYRDYDPALGRYLQPDPIGWRGGWNPYVYVDGNPVSRIDPYGLWGFGVTGGGSVEGGAVVVGAGATASAGAGVFWGGSQGVNVGAYGSTGAFAGGPRYGTQYPAYPQGNNAKVAGGAFAGVGAGAFVTNACSAGDLRGPFDTYTFNVGIGPIQATAQVGVSGGTWIGSVTVGPGVGISGSGYPTNTWATGP